MKFYRFWVFTLSTFSIFGSVSCANKSTTKPVAPVTTAQAADSTLNSATTGGDTTAPQISNFTPASSTVTSMPSQISLTFSEPMNTATTSQALNYSFNCTSGLFNPTAIAASGFGAVLTLPLIPGLASGNTCVLVVSSNLADIAGNFLTGSRTVTYTLDGIVPPSTPDTTPPTGTILTPLPSDRIYGSVEVSAEALDAGENQTGVSSVKFYIDSALAATATNAPYEVSINTATFSNGNHILGIVVTDGAGNESDVLDPRSVRIENHSYSTTYTAGGTGGTAFTDSAPTGMNMIGVKIRYGTYVFNLQPIWKTAFGDTITTSNGSAHGGTSGTLVTLTCPTATGNYRVVGFWGRAESSGYVNAFGLICKRQDGSGNYWYGTAFGGIDGTSYSYACPADTFATALLGRSGSRIDRVQMGCK